MSRRLLVTIASASLLVTGWTVLAFTCEEKATTAQAANAKAATCTAAQAAQCTAAQAAACKAKMSNAEMAHSCAGKLSAVTASNESHSCAGKMSAVTASNESHSCAGKMSAVTASNETHSCAGKASAVTASNESHCGGKTSAVTASNETHSCAGKASARTAGNVACPHDSKGMANAKASTCKFHGAGMAGASGLDAVVAGGPACSSHGAMARGEHAYGCDACADMAHCDDEIRAAGGMTQVVRLKNGVMFIHTANGAAHVRAIQAALTRRSDRLMALAASGDRAKLCPECKTMRGAMASGKLTREMVTIEGGCLTLMTSNDRTVIAKLHAMAGEEMARNKS